MSQTFASKLDALYLNLTELAKQKKLIMGMDKKRNSMIVNETKMKKEIQRIIKECDKDEIIIDGHYAVSVVPQELVSRVFVLRRDPAELRSLMEHCGFSGAKLWENMAAEILDVCLADALSMYSEDKVCELDISGKTVEEAAEWILDVLKGSKKCFVGQVDWIGKLEREGSLGDYLRF